MKKKFFVLCLWSSLHVMAYANYSNLQKNFGHKEKSYTKLTIQNKPAVLFVHPSRGMGGSEVTSSSMYELMHQNGFNTQMLVPKNSPLDNLLTERNLPHYCIEQSTKAPNELHSQSIFSQQVRNLCIAHKINIIQCFIPANIKALQNAVKNLRVKIVLMRHVAEPMSSHYLRNISGIITVSPDVEAYIQEKISRDNLKIKHITTIFPFFYEEKFLNYTPPLEPKQEFFTDRLQLTISNEPVICSIANFYSPRLHKKNQELLLRALHKLVYEKNKKVHVLFVGDGPDLDRNKSLCTELEVQEYAHFLGFRNDIADILYYSDINVLPSIMEAFGIVYLEAALIKKPSIGATNTGAEHTIVHGKTGLLFENNDLDHLVKQLEMLIDNPELRSEYGNNAYNFVTGKNKFNRKQTAFLKNEKFKQLKIFYEDLLVNQK